MLAPLKVLFADSKQGRENQNPLKQLHFQGMKGIFREASNDGDNPNIFDDENVS